MFSFSVLYCSWNKLISNMLRQNCCVMCDAGKNLEKETSLVLCLSGGVFPDTFCVSPMWPTLYRYMMCSHTFHTLALERLTGISLIIKKKTPTNQQEYKDEGSERYRNGKQRFFNSIFRRWKPLDLWGLQINLVDDISIFDCFHAFHFFDCLSFVSCASILSTLSFMSILSTVRGQILVQHQLTLVYTSEISYWLNAFSFFSRR